MLTKNSVWFITSSSRGVGRSLAEQVLAAGQRVVATARQQQDLDDLSGHYPAKVLALQLDVTSEEQRNHAVERATSHFGSIDVLVNNAGYGYLGAIEEGDEASVRKLFKTNVFAPLALIKKVLPAMRQRKSGRIINLSSIGGFVTFPGIGYYHMTKFALEALSETLAQELQPLGVHVTVVQPGAFRTDFRGTVSIARAPGHISDYDQTAGSVRSKTLAGDKQQPGDPKLAAKAILKIAESEDPPVRLTLGKDAYSQFEAKLRTLRDGLERWSEVSHNTDLA